MNTKLHTIVDDLGNPMEFLLSAGNDHDSIHAIELLKRIEISGSSILADRAEYSRLYLRAWSQLCDTAPEQCFSAMAGRLVAV